MRADPKGRALALGLLVAMICGSAQAAWAGTRLVTETRKVGGSGKVGRTALLVDGDRLRLDAADGRSSIIYRADREQIWMLDHEDKSFLSINQETTRNVASQLDTLRSELDARLEGLPPDQRRAMEQLMGDTIGAPAEPRAEIQVKKLESGDVVSGVVCHDVEILRAGARMALACRASYSAAGIGEGDLAVVNRLASFFEDSVSSLLPKEMRRQTVDAFGSLDELDGVPMRVRTYSSEGQPDRETLVTEIERETLAASTFQVPDGYSPRININVREGFGGP